MPLKSEPFYATVDGARLGETPTGRSRQASIQRMLIFFGRLLFGAGALIVCAVIAMAITQIVQFRSAERVAVGPNLHAGAARDAHLLTRAGAPARAGQNATDGADPFDLRIGFEGFGAVELTPRGPYAVDDVVMLTGDPAPGHRFSHWSGALSGDQNPITFTVTGPVAITATFLSLDDSTLYTITTNVVGGGAVQLSPSGPHRFGEVANLAAVAEAGWRFVRWSGDIGGNANPLAHTVVDDITATALFEPTEFPSPLTVTLTLESVGAGEVTVEPVGPYLTGQTITLTAIPGADWRFDGWRGHATGASNPLVMTILTNTLAVGVFAQAPTVDLRSVGPGTAVVQPAGPYNPGQTITLIAMPMPDAAFTGWSGDTTATANPHTFTLLGDVMITATFEGPSDPDPDPISPEPEPLELAVETTGSGEVQRDPPGPYLTNQTVTLQAQPAAGWRFSGWSGALSGLDNPRTIVITGELAVKATFVEQVEPDETGPIPPVVRISSVGGGVVTADPPAPHEVDQTVTLTATPDANQCFLGWSGALEGNVNPVALVITNDLVLAAEFGVCPLMLPMVAR